MGRHVARVESYAYAGLPAGTHIGMPSATLTLVIALDEPLELSGGPLGLEHRRLGVSVAGLHTSPVTIHHDGRMRGMHLDLTPAGSRALLGCPAGELGDRAAEGAEVLGALADRIREQLHETSDAARIMRFERSRAMVRHGIPAVDVASRCGYADQAHLVREWRRLAVTTPGHWVPDELAFVQDEATAGGAA